MKQGKEAGFESKGNIGISVMGDNAGTILFSMCCGVERRNKAVMSHGLFSP